MTPGTLYIVATPIGNLEDITLRALRVLREVSLIAAEDTRVTRKLLSHYDIHTPLIAYHQHSKSKRALEILETLVRGQDVAIVSDAGTPGILDPGHELIRLAIEAGAPVTSAPGANAIITALVISGLPTSHFAFDGFPPRKESERRAFFRSLRGDTRTVVLYESPLRLVSTLKSALAELGDRRVAVVREATKLFEEVFRGTLSEAALRFTERKARGEITIIIEGAGAEEAAHPEAEEMGVEDRLRKLIEEGMTERDAIRQVAAEMKLPKREVYAAAIRLKEL
ncbi:MAG: 16S rRNA (cytidine(1402)-2'-O)-methyltransferase [Armatimonadetes bacterium]|nr:16S rRNA (cytidine(1402)-2'-O)-methyltransferase [Armatimonadota bacterium]